MLLVTWIIASGLRLEGKALEFFFSLLIRSCQRAGNLFVRIAGLPARHAQAGFRDQIGIDLRSIARFDPAKLKDVLACWPVPRASRVLPCGIASSVRRSGRYVYLSRPPKVNGILPARSQAIDVTGIDPSLAGVRKWGMLCHTIGTAKLEEHYAIEAEGHGKPGCGPVARSAGDRPTLREIEKSNGGRGAAVLAP
jgi:hypothetical protein